MYKHLFSRKNLTSFILLPLFFLSGLLISQEITVFGQVYSVTNNSFQPITGASISIDDIDEIAYSDSTGNYSISFFVDLIGPITVTCEAEGFTTISETFFPDGTNYELNFIMNPQQNDDITFLIGFVFENNCDECPIGGTTISAYNINSPSDEVYSTQSGDSGHYNLELPINPMYGFEFNVTAHHPDFLMQNVNLEIGPNGATHNFSLVLNDPDPELGVYGHVYGPSINGMLLPISGAMISVWSLDIDDVFYTTESNEDGYYEIQFGPGSYSLICEKEGYQPFNTEFWVGNVPVNLPITLQLQTGGGNIIFSGTVSGAVGDWLPAYEPLTGARVQVFFANDQLNEYVETYTDDEGQFTFFVDDSLNGFPLFQEALVRVSAEGFVTQENWMNFYDWPITHDYYLELQTEPNDVFLSGNVYSPSSDDPNQIISIGGALLQIYGGFSGGLLDETMSNDAGYYSFDEVVTAANHIVVSAEGYVTQEHPLPGYNIEYPIEMDFYLELQTQPNDAFLSGNVYSLFSDDPNQINPIGGALLRIFGGFSGGLLDETVSNDAGYYSFGEIVTAATLIEISAEGYHPQEHPLPMYSDEYPIEMDFYLVPLTDPQDTGWAVGMVTAQFSQEGPTFPVENAVITAYPQWGYYESYESVTDANGLYSLELPVMFWLWEINCETEWGSYSQNVYIQSGNEVEVSFHFDTWITNDLPAPYDLIAEIAGDPDNLNAAALSWSYDILPDLTIEPVFNIYANILSPLGIEWVLVGETEELEFLYTLDINIFPLDEICFQVKAQAMGQESEPSNTACLTQTDPECFDLSGIDFGDCEMVLGIGWDGEECISISGCGTEVDGVEYSQYFFESMDECVGTCGDVELTGWIFGTVTGQLSPMGPVFPIAGVTIGATPAWGYMPVYETETNDDGNFELELAVWADWIVTCTTELGTQSQIINVFANEGTQIDFHFNSWDNQVPDPPYNLVAEYDPSPGNISEVFLTWDYQPFPDPTLLPLFNIYANLMSPNGEEWVLVGTTDIAEFIFIAEDNSLPVEDLCFIVTALSEGMESEHSNIACVNSHQEDCMDLSGIDFGPCDMILGIGWNGDECVWISGCSWETEEMDYSEYSFDSFEECVDACSYSPPPETAILYGTVNYLWDDAVELIAGAQIVAFSEDGQMYETVTGGDGGYELAMIGGGYSITCVLPETGESQSEQVYIDAGDMVNLDFWFGEFEPQFALTGMVFGITSNGDTQPLSGAHVVIYYENGVIIDAYTNEGFYWIDVPDSGQYQVMVSAEGYIDTEAVADVNGIAEYNFFLVPLDDYMLLVELSIGNVNTMPGDTVMVPLHVDIPRSVSGIQFTLVDDPDVATAINYESNLDCFSADFNDANGSAITIFFSIEGCILEEGSYDFATISYYIDPEVSIGDVIELWPEDVTISDPNGLPMEYLLSGGMITIGLPGDVNTDGDVNVLDIVNLVSYILLVEDPSDDQFSGGDINGDNILNFLDVVQIVNIIIGYDDLGNYSTGGSASLLIDHQSLKLEGFNVGGFQLRSNSGFSIIDTNLPEDWTLRSNRNMLIAYSTGEPLNGEISIQFSGKLTVDDLLVSDAAGEKISTEFVAVPEQFRLYANYPNPFNPQTTIRFDLDEPNRVSLKIYNILGEEVTELTDQYLPAGYHEFVWDASNQSDGLAKQTSSIYFVRLIAGETTLVQKVILMK